MKPAKFIISISISVILFLIVYSLLFGNNSATTTNIKTEQKSNIQKKWVLVTQFRGESIKTTQDFNIISEDWCIKWSTRPGKLGDMNFGITTYKSDGSLVGVSVIAVGAASDESYMHGSGSYYLNILTGQPYSIFIYEYK